MPSAGDGIDAQRGAVLAHQATPRQFSRVTPQSGLPIGHERTAGNRYGRDANSAAWWAIAAHTAYSYATGQAWSNTETQESLDYFMRLAVNDHESVYELVRDFKQILPEELGLPAVLGRGRSAQLLSSCRTVHSRPWSSHRGSSRSSSAGPCRYRMK
jgi:hypothetical protein